MTELDDDIGSGMEAFRNRMATSALTPSLLAGLPDDSVEQAILDYAERKIGSKWKHCYRIVSKLPLGIQAVYTTFYLDAEVRNGGFNQYFWNPTGQFAIEALEGLRFFGATEHASLLEAAVATFMREAPILKRFRMRNTLKAFHESYKATTLIDFDTPWYKLPDLSQLRITRIRSEPGLFAGK